MAENKTVSEIVAKFLLDTCRRRKTWNEDILDALHMCVMIASICQSDDDEFTWIPLLTGSVAELYIEPMYKCVGDVDIMCYHNNCMAIAAGHSPPCYLPYEFHSRVYVLEIIDSGYPGFVYLVSSYKLEECIEHENYNAVPCPRQYFSYGSDIGDRFGVLMHGPAMTGTGMVHLDPTKRVVGSASSVDTVYCVRCLLWPPQAADWPTRHRNHGWPDSATVDRIVSNGYDVVHVAHRLCRQDEWQTKAQWRLSFSRGEVVLMNSWMPVHQIVYHMLRVFVKMERLTDITDSTGSKLLSNYNVKTLMLWACELKPTSWWTDDLNVIRNCVELLHTLAVWLLESRCRHYFINNCNLFDYGGNLCCARLTQWLLSITESSLANWFVDNYVRRCSQTRFSHDIVSQLFGDVRTSRKLHDAASAVARWKVNVSSMCESMVGFMRAQYATTYDVHVYGPTVPSYWMKELANIDQPLPVYFNAVVFLHVAYQTTRDALNDEMLDALATTCLQSNDERHCFNARHSSVLSLRQTAKLMKVVANNSRSTVQLIEIELSKAYLYRASKDSDNDAIYCLANVYLAVLYYTTGHYQTAIDHCTLVTRSQDHSQCSSRVVQGELLPKIDDDIDNVFGLTVFYRYLRTAALNQKQLTHIRVFSAELLANYLHFICLSVTECHQFTQTVPADENRMSLSKKREMFTGDLLLCRIISRYRNSVLDRGRMVAKQPVVSCRLDTSELVELLQQSAVEHLTTFRQLEVRQFGHEWPTVSTDFESLFAYKRGDYQRCLRLSTHNVQSLIGRDTISRVYAFPEFIQLMDDDIASLTGLTLRVQPSCREDANEVAISQLSLSLYLMTQCQMKLHHSVTSLAETLRCVHLTRRSPQHKISWTACTLDKLLLKLTERKLLGYISFNCM